MFAHFPSALRGRLRLRAALLATTCLCAATMQANADDVVVHDGQVSGPVNFINDGGSLTVEDGGTVDGGIFSAVYAGGNQSNAVTNYGTITGAVGIAISSGTSLALQNYGTIEGSVGGIEVVFQGTGFSDFYNASTGVIRTETGAGIFAGETVLSNMVNEGTISSVFGDGIEVVNGAISGLTNSGDIQAFDYGITVSAGGLYDGSISNLVNSGTIFGEINGIFTESIDGLVNEAGGVIAADDHAVVANDSISNFVNSGLIAGRYGMGIVVINSNLVDFTNTSTGVITADTTGIRVEGGIDGFTNAGQILGYQGVYATEYIENFTNTSTGLIDATTYGVGSWNIGRLENSGRIFSDLGAGGYAIWESSGGDTELILHPGSLLRGRIDITGINAEGPGLGTNRLLAHNGLSTVLEFDIAPPQIVDSYNALQATDGFVVSVADTSVIAAQDNAVSDLTRSVSGVLGNRLDPARGGLSGAWIEGFGGASSISASEPAVDVDHVQTGIIGGVDRMLTDDFGAGVFGGFARGVLTAAVPYGQEMKTGTYFGGGYGRFERDAYQVGVSLTGGFIHYDSLRQITDNRVDGDTLVDALQEHDGYFVSPELTIVRDPLKIAGRPVRPSATLRYTRFFAEGFTETGVAEGGIVATDRTHNIIDTRFQLSTPVETGMENSALELHAGVGGRYAAGGTFDGTLLGVTTADFDPGGAGFDIDLFAGMDFSHSFSNNGRLVAAGEFGVGSEAAVRANARLGFEVAF